MVSRAKDKTGHKRSKTFPGIAKAWLLNLVKIAV